MRFYFRWVRFCILFPKADTISRANMVLAEIRGEPYATIVVRKQAHRCYQILIKPPFTVLKTFLHKKKERAEIKSNKKWEFWWSVSLNRYEPEGKWGLGVIYVLKYFCFFF